MRGVGLGTEASTSHRRRGLIDSGSGDDRSAMREKGESMRGRQWWSVVVAVGVLAGMGSGGAWGAGSGDVMPETVEDGSYPDAEAIYTEYGLRLLTGDGGIVFARVGSADDQCDKKQIQVERVGAAGTQWRIFCFDTVAPKGLLTLEVPGTVAIRSGDDPVQATVSLPGEKKVYQIAAADMISTDSGSDLGLSSAVLVELRLL